jgi:predicted metalloprotease with PDZ domain
MKPKSKLTALILSLAMSFAAAASAQTSPIKLDVDATDAPRYILHARLHIPAQAGPFILLYPKWLPGEHGPDGPITDLVGLKISAAGKTMNWQRDADNMFAFHLTVPAGVNAVDVSFDFLLPSGSGAYSSGVSSTATLLDLSWNQVLLYPQRTNAYDTQYAATLHLPEGWKFGTALPVSSSSDARIQFSPVSLETLVDSPVITGDYFRTVDLAKDMKPSHKLDIVADSAAALEIKPEDAGHFSHLVMEANALFGAHHYRDYHFLLTLSDHVAHFGLEHHESATIARARNF